VSWQCVVLSKVANVFNGKTPSKEEQRDVGHPVLKIKDVDDTGVFSGEFQSFVDFELVERFESKKLELDDTLILNAAHNSDYVGSKQYCAESKVVGALPTGEWLIARANQEYLHPRFLNYWLASSQARFQIKQLVKGIHLYPKDVARIEIPLPPLPEQKRIAAILDKADAIRRKHQQAIQLADEFLRSVFLDMFGDPVMNPKGWSVKPFSEVSRQITVGLVIKPASYYVEDGIPAIRSLNIKETGIDKSNFVFFSKEDNENTLAKSRVFKGDLVIVRSGQPGKAAVVPEELNGINAIDVLIVRPDFGVMNSDYLAYFFNSGAGKQIVMSEGRGQIQQHLNVGSLNSAEIPIPPIELQNEFANLLIIVRKRYSYGNGELYSDLFDSLSQKAFAGQL
jgi:type I restriction enzyme S subunit